MSNLDSFIQSSRPPPEPISTSKEIHDRKSIFSATILRATSLSTARLCINHTKHVVHATNPASHEIAAWRYMAVKEGKTGLMGEDDFECQNGSEDDGESWAGGRVLRVMKEEGVIDAVVIVSRWYGGVMLGPARFTHIETCAREVCRAFKIHEDLEDCLVSLASLDDILASLRAELNANSAPSAKKEKRPDYESIRKEKDLAKVKRLVRARENAIKSVKRLIAKEIADADA